MAWNFKDPTAGFTLRQAEGDMRSLYLQLSDNNPNLTNQVGNQIKANPSIVPTNPFIEKYFRKSQEPVFPGKRNGQLLYLMEDVNGLSDTDTLNQADRLTTVNGKSFPNCLSGAAGPSTLLRRAASTRGTTTAPRPITAPRSRCASRSSKGVSFDFNYTLRIRSIGVAARSRGRSLRRDHARPVQQHRLSWFLGLRCPPRNQRERPLRAPFGKGKWLLNNAGPVLDQIVNGWQISMIQRYRSGLPSSDILWRRFPDELLFRRGRVSYRAYSYGTTTYDQKGNPSVFASTTAASNWLPMMPGQVGTRAAIRLAGFLNFDIAVAKSFQLPWESQRLQFRAEAFNAFNNVNFYDPILDATSLSTFGEYQYAQPGRVMQFGLRYSFS